MKKILLTCILFVCASVYAQTQILSTPSKGGNVERFPSNSRIATKLAEFSVDGSSNRQKTAADSSIYLDWAEVEFNRTSVGNLKAFAWDINNGFTSLDTGSIKSAFISNPLLFDPYTVSFINVSPSDTLRVDTIWFRVFHEKNSASSVTNRIFINLVEIDTNGFPLANVFKRDTISTTTGVVSTNSGHNWLDSSKVFYITYGSGAGYRLPVGKSFAAEFSFAGAANDTFGMRAYYKQNIPVGPRCNLTSAPRDSSVRIALVTSAYRKYAFVNGGTVDEILPSYSGTTMSDFWYDCNNDGNIVDSTDAFIIQAWDAWAHVTKLNRSVGINSDLITKSLSIHPNPTTGEFSVSLDLSEAIDFALNITDIQGREVYNQNFQSNGKFGQNINLSSLNKGIYVVRVISEKGTAAQKLVIR